MCQNYRGADKYLARPGRKEATATKPYFCKPLKKNSEGCPSNQVSAAAMTYASDEKWRPFNCFFSQVGLRTYQHLCMHYRYVFKFKISFNTVQVISFL